MTPQTPEQTEEPVAPTDVEEIAEATVSPDVSPIGRDPLAATRLLITIAVWMAFSIVLPLIPYHSKLMSPYSLHYVQWIIGLGLPHGITGFLIRLPSNPEFIFRMTAFHFVPSLPFLILQILIGLRIVQMQWPAKVHIPIILASVIIWFSLFRVEFYEATHHGAFVTALVHVTPFLFNLSLTFAFSCLGVLLSKIVREPNVLLPVSLVAMPIDFVGAMTPVGFTSTMVARHPHAVSNVMVHVPHLAGLSLESMIGPGDILFIAFFFAAITRLGLNVKGTLWLISGLLSLTLLEVVVIGLPIAALVPMGISVICANFKYFKLKREELFAMFYAAIVVFAVVGVFYVLAHRALAR